MVSDIVRCDGCNQPGRRRLGYMVPDRPFDGRCWKTLAHVLDEMDAQSNDMRWRLVLAHNLAMAGGLYRAFALGDAGRLCGYEACDCWFPGCGKATP